MLGPISKILKHGTYIKKAISITMFISTKYSLRYISDRTYFHTSSKYREIKPTVVDKLALRATKTEVHPTSQKWPDNVVHLNRSA